MQVRACLHMRARMCVCACACLCNHLAYFCLVCGQMCARLWTDVCICVDKNRCSYVCPCMCAGGRVRTRGSGLM